MNWLRNLIRSLQERKYWKYTRAKTLPDCPSTISPLPDEVIEMIPMVIAGVSIVGEKGYICRTVTLLMGDQDHMYGWSLLLGHPDFPGVPYFFDTAMKSAKGTELPNSMQFYQAAVDKRMVCKDAPIEDLQRIFAYVLPHISDDGPPPCVA